MTPTIADELRALADKHMADKPPFVEHLYEACNGLRWAADEIERLQGPNIFERAVNLESLLKRCDRLTKALEWYATSNPNFDEYDGRVARVALGDGDE